MKAFARKHYHGELWPAACAAQDWRKGDEEKRRDVCLDCMELVGGPMVTTSDEAFGDDETTALFTYLRHLADPRSLTLLRAWEKCQADYRAYNRSKQADHWERRGFGRKGSPKLQRNRFAGRTKAVGATFDDPLPAHEADQRLWKFRQITRKREKAGKTPTQAKPPRRQLTPKDIPEELCPY